MSQFPPALSFLLDNEDRNREYAIVPDAGGFAISGINSRSWATAYANIAGMPQSQRAAAVANFYQTEFWNVMRLGGIVSQDLANRVLDEGVNAGPYTATKMLQEAVNTFNVEKLQVDGILGSKSLDAINAADQENLLAMYRSLRKQRYQKIAADNPDRAQYLKAWEARAEA